MPIRLPALILFTGLVLALPIAAAPTTSDLAREKNWADQVADTVVVGEPVWLSNRGHKFLGLYAPPAGGGTTAVILIHGRGVHPAWEFIDKLRSDLADAGFHTLSLQMPILAANARFSAYGNTFPEAFERIDAGIRFLREKGVTSILLLGHSSGAMTIVAYSAKHPQAPIAGIVAIGLSTLANGPEMMQPALMLRNVHVPVLDLYGSNDLHEVVSLADARRAAARQAGNKDYMIVRVPDASHFFTDRYEALRQQVLGWLGRFLGK